LKKSSSSQVFWVALVWRKQLQCTGSGYRWRPTDMLSDYQNLLHLADGKVLNVFTQFCRYTCRFRSLLKDFTLNILPLRQYSDMLRAWRSGFDPRWGRGFPRLFIPVLGHAQPLVKEVSRHFTGSKAAGAWRWLPNWSSPEVRARAELYIYSPFRDFKACSSMNFSFNVILFINEDFSHFGSLGIIFISN
jgi:hypothetical protein